jgi:Putative MetA-pathway of phenol degradation
MIKTNWYKLIIFLSIPNLALAEKGMPFESDKSYCSLLNPVPDELLRDFDTDRPDKANSPHTLDAGRFQVETGFFSYTRNKKSDSLGQGFSWEDTTLRIGLNGRAELQLEAPIYQENYATDTASRTTERRRGLGDLTYSLKTNFWGNDEGDSAAGMSIYLKIPTGNYQVSNGKVEGGILFLTDFKLQGDFDFGVNNGVSIFANNGHGYDANIINVISLSHHIFGPLSGYTEFFSSVTTQLDRNWEGTVDTGLLMMLGKNLQLDAGVNLGVTHSADDLQTFVGASYRF